MVSFLCSLSTPALERRLKKRFRTNRCSKDLKLSPLAISCFEWGEAVENEAGIELEHFVRDSDTKLSIHQYFYDQLLTVSPIQLIHWQRQRNWFFKKTGKLHRTDRSTCDTSGTLGHFKSSLSPSDIECSDRRSMSTPAKPTGAKTARKDAWHGQGMTCHYAYLGRRRQREVLISTHNQNICLEIGI